MTDVHARISDLNHPTNHRGQCRGDNEHPVEPQVLRPFHRSEALSIAEAADIANKSPRTIREWCHLHDIGRRIGGHWAVSRVALAMFLDGDKFALEAYLAGDRTSPTVTQYFTRCGVPLPRPQNPGLVYLREPQLSELNGASKP
jgi:Helix-turn-helix domain